MEILNLFIAPLVAFTDNFRRLLFSNILIRVVLEGRGVWGGGVKRIVMHFFLFESLRANRLMFRNLTGR